MSSLFPAIIHARIQAISLILIAVSLPLSPFLLSVSQFVLIGNWIAQGQYTEKWQRLKHNPALHVFLLIMIIQALGLLSSENLKQGMRAFTVKLPLLGLPIILASMPPLSLRHYKRLSLYLAAAIALSSFASLAMALWGFHVQNWVDHFWGTKTYMYQVTDTRQLSIFISHIRLSLIINMSLFSLFYFLVIKRQQLTARERILAVILSLWLFGYLILLQSLTGFITLAVSSGVLTLRYIPQIKIRWVKWTAASIIVLFPLLVIGYLNLQVNNFYKTDGINTKNLDNHTSLGNRYNHRPNNKAIENGHLVWIYVCDKELRQIWNKRSKLKYDGYDNRGNLIRFTLIRYLSSRGLRKDAKSLEHLKQQEISGIENGVTNYRFLHKHNLSTRIYQVIWEFDRYRNSGNPSGHSVTQRCEFLKAGWHIAKQQLWTGIGIGDLRDAFQTYYTTSKTRLAQKYWHITHNQFLTFIITVGLPGAIFTVFAMLWPAYKQKRLGHFLFVAFITIALLSMLNEDTLEGQSGVTFFSYFYALIIWGINFDDKQ